MNKYKYQYKYEYKYTTTSSTSTVYYIFIVHRTTTLGQRDAIIYYHCARNRYFTENARASTRGLQPALEIW